VEGLTFVYFDEGDVVRHPLVQRIIRAYDEHKTRVAEDQMALPESESSTNGKAAALERPLTSSAMPSPELESKQENRVRLSRRPTRTAPPACFGCVRWDP